MGGKLPPELLTKYVLSRIGVRDRSVIVGPTIGEDAAIIDVGEGKILALHADPITGAIESIGWLAVHIACNDIAVRGVKPRWLLPVLLLPEDVGEDVLDTITRQMDEAARELGVAIVGGHSEYTPGLKRPIVSMTAVGLSENGRYITTSGARVGDTVIMTKTAAVEGTAILSTDFRDVLLELGVPQDVLERGRRFLRGISVVREALTLADADLVTAMHDPTEGGVLGGLIEIAYASNKTVEIWEEFIPVAEETRSIVEALELDPLKLISSGTLIATVPSKRAGEALELLKGIGVEATAIGRVRDRDEGYVVLHRGNGAIERFYNLYVEDELYAAWKRWSRSE